MGQKSGYGLIRSSGSRLLTDCKQSSSWTAKGFTSKHSYDCWQVSISPGHLNRGPQLLVGIDWSQFLVMWTSPRASSQHTSELPSEQQARESISKAEVSLSCNLISGMRFPITHGKTKVKVTQSCPTLCDPMDYEVHGILQARILHWVTFPFSRESSQPRDGNQVSRIAGRFFTSWATREAQE